MNYSFVYHAMCIKLKPGKTPISLEEYWVAVTGKTPNQYTNETRKKIRFVCDSALLVIKALWDPLWLSIAC